jgi:spermidine/putrescine transport system substrate-binding protein
MARKRFMIFSLLATVLAMIVLSGAAHSATARSAAQATAAATTAATAGAAATMAATMAPAAPATPVATLPFKDGKPQELKIFNFTTYIADDTIANFEKLYNVKVTYDTFGKADELFAKMQAGNPGYDIIVAPDYMITQLAGLDLLLPLDLKALPNWEKNGDPAFKNPAYDPNNKFSVVYQWGTQGLAYNKAKVAKPITSMSDLLDPATYNGAKKRVALLNSTRETMGLFLAYLGLDPNTTKVEDLEKVRDLIIKNKDLIAAFHDDDGQTRLAGGQVDAVTEWSGDVFQTMAEPGNENIVYVIPKEGALRWTDNLAVPKGATNKALAELFINYVYDPGVAAAISNYTQYGTPNKTSIDMKLIDPALLTNPAIYPPADVTSKLFILKDLGDQGAIYDQVWAEIVAGVSQ